MHRPLRILTAIDVPPDPNAGAAGTVYHTNVALRELGHEVDELWAHDLGLRRIRHGNLHGLLEQPIIMMRAIRRRCETVDYDFILSHQPQSYLAAKTFRRAGKQGLFLTVSQGVENRIAPIVLDWHRRLGMPQTTFPRSLLSPTLRWLLARQWPRAVRWSDGVIVDNAEDRSYIAETYGLDSARIHISAGGLAQPMLNGKLNGGDITRFERVIHIGQFAFYKGPHLLAEIVNRLLDAAPALTMTWVCRRQDHPTAAALIRPNLRNRVQFFDLMPQQELAALLDRHGIFLFTSIAEGFGRAGLEAMARGLCVIASDCCGMRDYIEHGRTGFLCKVGAIEEFVERSLHITRHRTEAIAIAAAAQRAASQYTWSGVAAHLISFLDRLRSKVGR